VLSLALFVAVILAAAALLLGTSVLRTSRAHRAVVPGSVAGLLVLLPAWLVTTDWYDVRKLVGTCLMPAGLVWLGMLALSWRLSRTDQTALARLAWLLWIGATLAGNVWVGRALVGWLEAPWTRVDATRVEPLDAVAVLGGGLTRHDHGQIVAAGAADRVVLGARLQLAGTTRILITTGPVLDRPGGTAVSLPAATAELWHELGVPADRVIVLEGPRTTSDEIARLEELLRTRSFPRLGLLTSAIHLRRALRLCERAGLEVVPLPADFSATRERPQPMDLVPQKAGFTNVQRACWELLGAAVGR
jgi:uncharacterized SAM-binding protein YcdF (DUF218 family)